MSKRVTDLKSTRKDGRGHWPEGKRRKPPPPGAAAVQRILKSQCEQRGRNATARLLSVDPRTVSRWASGERYPSEEEAGRIRELATMP